MDDIIKRLDRIEKILIEQQKSQKKLNDHIVFVEETYKVVRSPMQTVLSYFSNQSLSLTE